MKWKKVYEDVLKKVCEKEYENEDIVEVDFSKLQDKLVKNENAKEGAIFGFKLSDNATEDDYKMFCELIYNYIGLDIYNFIEKPKQFEKFGK